MADFGYAGSIELDGRPLHTELGNPQRDEKLVVEPDLTARGHPGAVRTNRGGRSPDFVDEVDGSAQRGESGVEGVTSGIEADGAHASVAPDPQPVPHHGLGADEGGGEHHVVGDEACGTVVVAGLPLLADLGGDVGPALPAVGAVVVVRR